MAIQPIDLQALFTQLDKVGKNQAMLREGQQIQDSLQQLHSQRKLEENVRSVNESQKMGDDAETIKDQKGNGSQPGEEDASSRESQEEEVQADDKKQDMIRDPALGRNIDISG